jgi:hypothetical protein
MGEDPNTILPDRINGEDELEVEAVLDGKIPYLKKE